MVVLTYTFVNGIEPAVSPTGQPVDGEPPFPTTPSSSTTTLPPEVAAYMVTLDIFQNQLDQFSNAAETAESALEKAGTKRGIVCLAGADAELVTGLAVSRSGA